MSFDVDHHRSRLLAAMYEAKAAALADPETEHRYTEYQFDLTIPAIEIECKLLKMLNEGADRGDAISAAVAATAGVLDRLRQRFGPAVLEDFTRVINDMTTGHECVSGSTKERGGNA
jgi:hypothetical protein